MSDQKIRGVSPFVDWLGLDFSVIENGYSRCTLEINEKMLNSNSILHGGVVYSMADTGMGGALDSCLGEGEKCATIEINIVYLKVVTKGELVCETSVIHRGSDIAVMASEVRNGDSLVAKALGTFAIINPREMHQVAIEIVRRESI